MELHKLFRTDTENRAVSPVIGVILMVAITVILAAVIGTFVLGLGEQVQENPPQASFTFDYTAGSGTSGDCGGGTSGDGLLDITHDGGDKITAADLSHSGSSVSGADSSWDGCGFGTNSDVTAGDGVSTRVNSGDTVRVVWNAGADSSSTLGKWTGPDA